MAIDPVAEHERSALHRDAVAGAGSVGSFYCSAIYDPRTIVDWTDEDARGVGQTAICPKCGIDAVVPVRPGVDEGFLQRMRRHWFS